MISASGISRRELYARPSRWTGLLFAACLVTIGACASPSEPEPTQPLPANTVPVQSRPSADPTASIPTALPGHLIGLGEPTVEYTFEAESGWEVGSSSQGAVSRLGGRLIVSVQGPGAALSSLSPLEALADFSVQVEVHSEICEAGDEYGLMVRTVGPGNPGQDSHYRFLITCDGSVRASRFLSGAEAPILPITARAEVVAGAPSVNRIGVSAIGDEFHFFVNDVEIYQLVDAEIPSGRIGLFVRARRAAQTTVSFDDFRLWDLTED